MFRLYPTGDALFRDHFECFVAPPFDEWFGFDALPPADDPARGRRAVAEAYAAVVKARHGRVLSADAAAAEIAKLRDLPLPPKEGDTAFP